MKPQLNEKKSKESKTRLMSWDWKRKPIWRNDLTTNNSHPWIMFSFNWLVIIWRGGRRGVRLKLDVQGKEGGRRWAGGLENWTIFTDLLCVSCLKAFILLWNQNYDNLKTYYQRKYILGDSKPKFVLKRPLFFKKSRPQCYCKIAIVKKRECMRGETHMTSTLRRVGG